MNGTELARAYGLSKMSVSKKAKSALDAGLSVLVLDDDTYRFSLHNGKYDFSKVERVRLLGVDDFEAFSPQKQKEAQLKYELIKEYLNRGTQSYEAFMQGLSSRYNRLDIKKRQFFRWLEAVQTCPQGKSPLPLLLDRRGKAAKPKKFDEAMQAKVVKMYLAKPHRAVRRMYEYLQKEYKEVPSYEVVRKFVDHYKATHTFEVAFAKSPDRAKGKFKPAGGSMSEGVMVAHALWELDATPADVICNDGKRYTISGMIDVYSRRVVMSVESSSSAYSVSRLMRKAILKFGVPSTVKIDNGKEYLSHHFASLCDRLQIHREVCPPYSGEYKPHIERFFGRLSHELFEEIDGYIGHSVPDRQALQDQTSHRGKMESRAAWRESHKNGDEFAHKFALKKENLGLEVAVPLSATQLQEVIDAWIEQKYETRVHGTLGCTPLEKYHGAVENRMEDERALDMYLGMEVVRTIRKKGVEWNAMTYWSELFGDIVGQKVHVLSDNNLGHVYIYDMQKKYLCTALNPAMHNIDRSAFTGATKRYNAKVAKAQKLQEELRRDEPKYMLESLKLPEREQTKTTQECHSDPQNKAPELTQTTQEMPTFKSVFEKFVWVLEHDKVDEKIRKLADKYPESWELALSHTNAIQTIKKAG